MGKWSKIVAESSGIWGPEILEIVSKSWVLCNKLSVIWERVMRTKCGKTCEVPQKGNAQWAWKMPNKWQVLLKAGAFLLYMKHCNPYKGRGEWAYRLFKKDLNFNSRFAGKRILYSLMGFTAIFQGSKTLAQMLLCAIKSSMNLMRISLFPVWCILRQLCSKDYFVTDGANNPLALPQTIVALNFSKQVTLGKWWHLYGCQACWTAEWRAQAATMESLSFHNLSFPLPTSQLCQSPKEEVCSLSSKKLFAFMQLNQPLSSF